MAEARIFVVSIDDALWVSERGVIIQGTGFGFLNPTESEGVSAVIFSPSLDPEDLGRIVIPAGNILTWANDQISLDLPLNVPLGTLNAFVTNSDGFTSDPHTVRVRYANLTPAARWVVKLRDTVFDWQTGFLGLAIKDPAERRLYTFDLTDAPELLAGQFLDSATVTTPTLALGDTFTLEAPAIDATQKLVQLWISGGVAEKAYDLTCTALTNGGATLVLHGTLIVASLRAGVLEKYGPEVRRYEFDLSQQAEIAAGQTIASVTSITATGLTLGEPLLDSTNRKVQFQVAGGTTQTGYEVVATGLYSAGATFVERGTVVML